MKHARADANCVILTKRIKLQHEKKTVSNLLSRQSVGFDQKFMKFIYLFRKNSFFTGKKPLVETISVTIPDSSDVRCLDLQLKNIFTKRQEDVETLRSSSHLIVYLLLLKI